jgi:GTP pyrophosphokinase
LAGTQPKIDPLLPPAPVKSAAREGPRYKIADLCSLLDTYLPSEQVREVYRAFMYGAEAHDGQKRLSGEPYIYHPLAVARILAEMRMDYKGIMAALLHDVIEDTGIPKDEVVRVFDGEIAELVDGVSKLTQIDFRSQAEVQAASFRKMMLAMTRDIRVILIKLADRLHNMRTIGSIRREKARRIARETLEIYAPIANRLGINTMKLELEELAMVAYWPWRHRVLDQAVRDLHGNRREVLSGVETAIRGRLVQEGLDAQVYGREKHLFSIYRKIREKRVPLSEIADVFGFRIVVGSVDACYRALGITHNLYKPVPGRFKDYIALPKPNGYQALHTVLFGPHGMPIEIQIRTDEMHRIAESGIAAHWQYKSRDADAPPVQLASEWLQHLLDLQKGSGNSVEFLEHVKLDLFPDEVYVFTPRGQILVLPKHATVVDFAYAVHTDVGNHCVGARIDRRFAPLHSRLRSGQTVEIVTAPVAHPNPAWLDFVVTSKARANIRAFLKQLQHREAVELGRRLLEKELENHGRVLAAIPEEEMAAALAQLNLRSREDLYEEIGLGNRMPLLVALRLAGGEGERSLPPGYQPGGPLAIRGTEGMVVKFAKCCRPIPGDPVVALFNRGKGLVVHHQSCHNLGEFRHGGNTWFDVRWAEGVEGEFPTEIKVEAGNQRGVLATVAAAIAEQGSNIESVRSEERDGLTSTLRFVINVRGRQHLARILRRLRHVPAVMRIARVIG